MLKRSDHDVRDLRRATAYRRPLAAPIEAVALAHPALPSALAGLTILQLSDLHVRHFAPRRESFKHLLRAIDNVEADLVVFTGDLMDEPGQEAAAIATLRSLLPCCHALTATLGILGNHDSPDFLRAAREELPELQWLINQPITLDVHGHPLRVLGLSYPEDPLGALLASRDDPAPFTLALAHHPGCMIACAELGVPLILAGHTHAGQVRLSPRLAPHTSSDLPPHLATGVLRLGSTLMAISRGIGDGVIEHLRINCPRQVPLYTLSTGPLPPLPPNADQRVVNQVIPW